MITSCFTIDIKWPLSISINNVSPGHGSIPELLHPMARNARGWIPF